MVHDLALPQEKQLIQSLGSLGDLIAQINDIQMISAEPPHRRQNTFLNAVVARDIANPGRQQCTRLLALQGLAEQGLGQAATGVQRCLENVNARVECRVYGSCRKDLPVVTGWIPAVVSLCYPERIAVKPETGDFQITFAQANVTHDNYSSFRLRFRLARKVPVSCSSSSQSLPFSPSLRIYTFGRARTRAQSTL